jgi:hypothetical protein
LVFSKLKPDGGGGGNALHIGFQQQWIGKVTRGASARSRRPLIRGRASVKILQNAQPYRGSRLHPASE